jgi:hypothetical protein
MVEKMKKFGDRTYYRTINMFGIKTHQDMHPLGILHLMDFNPYHHVRNNSMLLLSSLRHRKGFIPISPSSDIYQSMANGSFSDKLDNAKNAYREKTRCYVALQNDGGSITGYGDAVTGFVFNKFEHWLPKNCRKLGLKRKKSAIFLKS